MSIVVRFLFVCRILSGRNMSKNKVVFLFYWRKYPQPKLTNSISPFNKYLGLRWFGTSDGLLPNRTPTSQSIQLFIHGMLCIWFSCKKCFALLDCNLWVCWILDPKWHYVYGAIFHHFFSKETIKRRWSLRFCIHNYPTNKKKWKWFILRGEKAISSTCSWYCRASS